MFRLIVLFAVILTLPVEAAVIIDIKARGMGTRLMMNADYARVDNSTDGSYLLLHRPSDQSYLVLPDTKQVMKLEDDSATVVDALKVELQAMQSTEQKMFGYPVRRYRIMANQQYCGDVFASQTAMQDLGVKPMLSAVASMLDQQLKAMGPYVAVIDKCMQASMTILSHAQKIGMPLRMYDARGQLLSDVVNIDTSAVLAAADLSFPSDYSEVSSTKELNPFNQAVKQVRKQNPRLNSIYESVEQFSHQVQDRYRQYRQR